MTSAAQGNIISAAQEKRNKRLEKICINSTTYIKFIRKDYTHHGFTYGEGINEDPIKFEPCDKCKERHNADPSKSELCVGCRLCKPGGLYFTNVENGWRWMNFGELVAIVILPPKAKTYECTDSGWTKMRADKLQIEIFLTFGEFFALLQLQCSRDIFEKYINESIKINGLNLQHVPIELRTQEFCRNAVKQNKMAIEFLPEELKVIKREIYYYTNGMDSYGRKREATLINGGYKIDITDIDGKESTIYS